MLLIKARLLSFHADPFSHENCYSYEENGVLAVKNGIIIDKGDVSLVKKYPDSEVKDYSKFLAMAGFIDLHLHMPQTQVIASYGKQLLDWLNSYTFVEEAKYKNESHAQKGAELLIETLIQHGTTTPVCFCSSHVESVEATFQAASAKNMLIFAGKVLMDRNAPEALLDTPQRAYDESKALIAKWHGKTRNNYVISPRFAITSSEAQLDATKTLANEFQNIPIQTHLSENKAEIEYTLSLFPKAKNYLDIYHKYDLVRENALLGHAIHLEEAEFKLLNETKATAVHCPTSNLFLGSGLFPMQKMRERHINYGVASDIGAGTSYSMLATLNETYKIQALQNSPYSALQGFYDITLGNAKRLNLSHKIGTLEIGSDADFILLDSKATPAMAHRAETLKSLEEELFLLMTLGDDRAISSVYIAGKKQK